MNSNVQDECVNCERSDVQCYSLLKEGYTRDNMKNAFPDSVIMRRYSDHADNDFEEPRGYDDDNLRPFCFCKWLSVWYVYGQIFARWNTRR